MIQVNSTTIPESSILAEMQYHPADSQRDAMLKAAESLIISELLRQRASELGLSVANNASFSGQQDFIEQLIEHEIAIPAASEEECLHYFEQNPHRFMTSPLLEVSHVLIMADPEQEKERMQALTIAESVLAQLQTGAAIEDMAKQYSACPSSAVGGSLGQISRGQTVPEFERVVFKAEVGLVPQLVETRYGFHVVWVHRKVAGQPQPYEAVKDTIQTYLHAKVRQKAIAQYIHTLISQAEIDGYDFAVSTSPLMQ
ncbi:MAG: peptidylprolyl isomerase [Bacterioplanes sp.]|nr:peptidylprolyl isomerase [Bacterioplanes sp.]